LREERKKRKRKKRERDESITVDPVEIIEPCVQIIL
jgi:hypothetical protein